MKNVIDAEHVGNARGRNEQLNLIVRSNTSTLNFAERKDAKLLGGLRYARASSMRGSARNALGRGLYTGKLVSADKAYRMGKQLRALHRLEDEMRVQQTPEYLRLVFQNDADVDQLVDVHDAIQTEMKISSMSISDWSFELFPFIVQRHVDIYSARLENLLEYSFNHAFMLHEHCQAELV
ncbi:hypothetical protein DD237_005803 [Peronospora effusa]|uniref:Uncharacterized protein n=1 Tax=Peronospora effusa TaxID=542832 RepID=A0A425C7J3_9STRA|nr:hypothetical protein DD237_005803 [Peronospora effusa]